MRHLTWVVTWMTVGLVTTLAVANVLTYHAQLHRPAAPPPSVEPVAPAPEPVSRPMAKAKPPVEFSRSLAGASHRQRATTN